MWGIPAGGGVRRGSDPRPDFCREEVPPRAGSARLTVEVWWKLTAGERGLFRFLRTEDVPPEQFAPLAVRHLLGSSLAGLVGYGRKRFKK